MVSIKSVQKIETSDITDLAVITEKLNDLAVTKRKLADGAVTTAKIADDGVGPAKVSTDLIQAGRAAINSVESNISFSPAFSAAPTVVAVGEDVLNVKVTGITSDHFTWIASSSGHAFWAAFYYT